MIVSGDGVRVCVCDREKNRQRPGQKERARQRQSGRRVETTEISKIILP